MIDKLKFLIDQSEDKPKIKKLLLNIAELPEDKQETAIQLVQMMIEAKE